LKKLDDALFSTVVANTPLISIDLVIKNNRGEVLLGRRKNRPAQGKWFVPGGRIHKNESIQDAFLRLSREEIGVGIQLSDGKFLGVFEHFYPDNFSEDGFSTHYVVLGYLLILEVQLEHLPQTQHEKYCWWEPQKIMSSDEVHLHSKWYIEPHLV
jgi:colanic acid biosynthesis protein WcaH